MSKTLDYYRQEAEDCGDCAEALIELQEEAADRHPENDELHVMLYEALASAYQEKADGIRFMQAHREAPPPPTRTRSKGKRKTPNHPGPKWRTGRIGQPINNLCTATAAAKILGCTATEVRELTENGRLPYYTCEGTTARYYQPHALEDMRDFVGLVLEDKRRQDAATED